MLRFNAVFFRPCEQLHEISIHPMLRFNSYTLATFQAIHQFQYILCYGSTIAVHMIYAFHYTGITLKHQQFL